MSNYFRAARLGSIVRLPDGRIATTVYNGLDGIGIKWGRHEPPAEEFDGTSGGTVACADDSPARASDWPWKPDAMLRDPYPGAVIPCVGAQYELVESGLEVEG